MCGEVLDVDGVTGGFNFMNCWSTGFVAGEGAAEFCIDETFVHDNNDTVN
jgi:predicted flavoprotein YhiN